MLRYLYKLSVTALIFTSVVIVLGAYTRLTDAGLGCPDWPGCYGFLTVPSSSSDVLIAEQAFPERPVEAHKAWNEMIHRYFAGSLGLMVLAIFVLSLLAKQNMLLPSILLGVVTFQAMLGMWTVTMNLQPLVVMGHLLGGFTTFSLLFVLVFKLRHSLYPKQTSQLTFSYSQPAHVLIKLAIVVLVLQIALGGWTASNYAALACTDLPICRSNWQQEFDLTEAFSIPTGHADYEYGVFSEAARMTIHVMHRFGAIMTTLILSALIITLLRNKHSGNRRLGLLISVILSTQLGLGLANVVFHLPLYIAVAHNFVAACLLLSLLYCYLLSRSRRAEHILINNNPNVILA